MKKRTEYLFLLIIITVGLLLRLWQLGNVPISPDWDEAALGYNAYSIMQTGRDEYGKFLPIVLRSFDDYKPALYAYFIIPFIKIFDLTIIAVRLPSAIFGNLTIIATYFLVKELFKKSNLALLSSFLLAISPWHIQFSRIAFESNVGVTFNIFSALFFLLGLRKPWLLAVATMCMGLNLYIYQSEKVFTSLLALMLIIVFRKELFSLAKKYLITALLVGFIIALPLVSYTTTNKEALSRAQGVSIFSSSTPFLKRNVEKILEDRKNNNHIGLVLDNRRVEYAKSIISGYISHFDLNWLFITGDISRHHAPSMGLLYLFELPFLLIGIYMLVFGRFDFKIKAFVFVWFLITPIPASITSGVPHAVRTLNFLPTFQIFIAIGLLTIVSTILNMKYEIVRIKIKYIIFSLFFLFFIFNFLYYINQYFVQQNYFNSKDWQYGYEEAVSKVKEIEGKYKKIIVSNQPHLDQSYMFFLFYLKYPPVDYQKESVFASGGFRETHTFGKFEFRPFNWEEEKIGQDTLFIGRPLIDFPENDEGHIKTIYFLDGAPAIKLAEGL